MKNKLLPILLLALLSAFSISGQTVSDEQPDDAEVVPTNCVDLIEEPAPKTAENAVYLNYQIFLMIRFDMTYDEVRAIIGTEGDLTSHSKSGSYESKFYEWKGEKYARISVRFQNGKLVSKAQSSLTEMKGTAELTREKFERMETGMPYETIVGIVGSEGELTTMSKYGDKVSYSYTWKGPEFERIYVSFTNNGLNYKVQSNLK